MERLNNEDIGTRIKQLAADLRYNPAEEGDAAALKWILWNILDPGERALLLIYAETGSVRKAGKILGVSHTTAAKVIRGLKAKVMTVFQDLKEDEDLY